MKPASHFLSDAEVIARVLSHAERGETDRGDTIWREPAENYVSEERFARELELIATRPIVFCPSAALAEVGSYVTREVAGRSLFAVRGHDGAVRVFKNACRHRGARLADGVGCQRAFVCPYHGWAYRLDGHLQSIPDEDGFGAFDKSAHGLVEAPSIEKDGLVFVVADPRGADVDWSGVANALPPTFHDDQRLVGVQELVIEANWKLHLESFIEGYHIKHAHPETFYPFGYDNLNVVELCGQDARVTYPFRRIEALRDVPADERDVTGMLTYVYHLFPNTIITVMTHHTNVLVIDPVSVSQTRQRMFQISHGSSEAALADAKRDIDFVTTAGAPEDIALVTGIQRSLGAKANDVFTFGHFEAAIVHFHQNMSAAL